MTQTERSELDRISSIFNAKSGQAERILWTVTLSSGREVPIRGSEAAALKAELAGVAIARQLTFRQVHMQQSWLDQGIGIN